MARPKKEGLDYFPFNVDFFNDDKIAFVSSRFGEKGENITIKLLCKIYKDKGYYYQWGEDESVLFAQRELGHSDRFSLANDVVLELVKRDFFDKGIYDSFKILTSSGIQNRYHEICKLSKRIFKIRSEISLLSSKPPLTPSKPPFPPEESTQRKGKEIKGNESKGTEAGVEEEDKLIFHALKEKILSDPTTFSNFEILYKLSGRESLTIAEVFFTTKLSTGEYKQLQTEDSIRRNLTYWIPKSEQFQKIKNINNATNSRNTPTAKIITPKRLNEGY